MACLRQVTVLEEPIFSAAINLMEAATSVKPTTAYPGHVCPLVHVQMLMRSPSRDFAPGLRTSNVAFPRQRHLQPVTLVSSKIVVFPENASVLARAHLSVASRPLDFVPELQTFNVALTAPASWGCRRAFANLHRPAKARRMLDFVLVGITFNVARHNNVDSLG